MNVENKNISPCKKLQSEFISSNHVSKHREGILIVSYQTSVQHWGSQEASLSWFQHQDPKMSNNI